MSFSAAPDIENQTAFAFEPVFLADESGAPLFVPIIKATFLIGEGPALALAEEQRPVNLGGEYWGEPDTSSYRYEPECAFVKPTTDVALIGHAYPARAGATEVLAGIRIGGMQKLVRVHGDRHWERRATGRIVLSDALAFERIPLVYERAFGGWDRQNPDPALHAFEPRNPVGTGLRVHWSEAEQRVRAPNIEDPSQPLREFGDRPAPTGLGFLAPHWLPRSIYAGTYDQAWMNERSPLLPANFDRRFFNAASPGLIAPAYLRGDEAVTIANASPRGQLSFALPGLSPPLVSVALRGGRNEELSCNLDTVIIDTDAHLVILIWRAHLKIRDVPRDILGVRVGSERIVEPGEPV